MSGPAEVERSTEPPVKSIDKAMRLLKAIAAKPDGGAMFVELTHETGLSKATAHRLLSALVDVGFVYQDTGTRKYRLGSASMLLGRHAVTQEIAFVAQACLDRIAAETADTAFVSVPEGRSAVCVGTAMGDFPIRSLTLSVGDRRPLGVGAGSLALLSAMPDVQIEKILEGNTGAYKGFPNFNSDVIRKMVARTRKEGYAFNEGHIVQGMCAIGVAVLNRQGQPIAALSMSAITERVSGARKKTLVDLLHREAKVMRRELAGSSKGFSSPS